MGGPELSIILVILMVLAVPSLLAYLDLRRSGQGKKVGFIVLAFVVCWPLAFVLWVYWHTHAPRAIELAGASR